MQMKKFLVALLAASTLATPAFAEPSDTATVNLTGNVEDVCTIVPNATYAGQSGMTNQTYVRTDDAVAAGWRFVIANTNDPTQASIGDTSQAFFSIAFDTFCNDNFTWTTSYTNGALRNAGTAPAGFTNSLPYSVDIKQIGTGAGNVSGETAPTAGGTFVYNSHAFDGTSQIDIAVAPSGALSPIAGDYQETITMTFVADS
jgi:hypothetical protein